MENLLITLFILVANVVGLLLVYHSFDKRIDKEQKTNVYNDSFWNNVYFNINNILL